MEYTKNLKLSKPSYNDDVDIQVLNNNMDLLDDKVGNLPYLPLAGGTMRGNINVPYNVGLYYNPTHYINFYNTSFQTIKKDTVLLKGDRFKYYSPSGKELVADDSGIWWDNDSLIRDLYTNVGWHSGYTKLSTGLLLQWGYVNPNGSAGNIQHVTFKTPMLNPQYAVVVSKSNGVDGKPSGGLAGEWWSATYNFTTTGFDVVCDQPSYGHTVFWIAIGKGV